MGVAHVNMEELEHAFDRVSFHTRDIGRVPYDETQVVNVAPEAIPFDLLRQHDAALSDVFDDVWSSAVKLVPSQALDNFETHLIEPSYPVKHSLWRRFVTIVSMSWASLGVVYGDIGTSPIYTVNGSLSFLGHIPTPDEVKGLISLLLWSLILIVAYKYVILVLSTGYYGKGGAFALVSKLMTVTKKKVAREVLVLIGCLAFALILADGVITPAISVLSAVEGVLIPAPQLGIAFTNPIAIFILVGIYFSQRIGTKIIGYIFSPVILLWFITLCGFGIYWVIQEPGIFEAFNPWLGINFIITNQVAGWLNLSYVILCCTGGEALFADKGHFGANPIRISWFLIVFPALLLNYLGQGALLLMDPSKIDNPFFHMMEGPLYWPVFVLAILATIIASQAVISALFTLSQQAINLKVLPRLHIIHTNVEKEGQVYVPVVNWILAILGIAIVIGFQRSSALSATYGFTVSADMFLTSILFCIVVHRIRHWFLVVIIPMMLPVIVLEFGFLTATCSKIPTGAWFTLTLAFIVTCLSYVWHRGTVALDVVTRASYVDMEDWSLRNGHLSRSINRFFLFLTDYPVGVPPLIDDMSHHTSVLPIHRAILSIRVVRIPFVRKEDMFVIETLEAGAMWRIVWTLGYQQDVNLATVCSLLERAGLPASSANVTFVFARKIIEASPTKPWYHRLMMSIYLAMYLFEHPAYLDFQTPPRTVMEIGQTLIC
jgi:KUP system potassium uptake protein